ncbi:MAG: ROK family transcriptional regulator [Rhodoferax sp.]|nr:ROK family transcriptional regulator [Rhodoferax sp.]
MKTTGDQQLVKRINRSVLLRLVRTNPGLSRAQLASRSGLTKSTVSLLVRELITEGWLCETQVTATHGLGRPSTPLHLNDRSRGLIGVEVAVEALRVVGVSLAGQVLCATEEPLKSTKPADVCRQAARLITRTHGKLHTRGVALLGVGLGLPGAFDEATGVLRFAPNLGWRNVDFARHMAQALARAGLPDVPVHVQNEADTAALSEYEFSDGDRRQTVIFVTCGAGVGAGIVLNDRLFAGAQGMAGEIGHSILQIDGPLCSCGRKGCAETFLGARALAKSADPTPAGHYLGVLLQNLWTTFNPDTLILGGPSCDNYPAMVQTAQQTLQRYAAAAGMTAPRVRLARYGMLASAVGAAALVLHHELRPLHSRAPAAPPRPEVPVANAPAVW